MRVTVRVPATSANLGPGFDCFGLALELCNEIVVDTEGAGGVAWEGEGADDLPLDGSDLIHATMRRVAGARSLPAFAMRAVNRVPLARGLGSSSAAVVAGAAIAMTLLGDDPSPGSVFAHATAIEGHPDNAAPACFGGFTIAMPEGFVRRLDPHPDLRPTLLVPEEIALPTHEARAALPATVPRADAVYNVAHAALAVEALTRDPTLLGHALRDRLHQDVRLGLVPAVRDVLDAVLDAGVAACVSGAGPAVLAFPGPGQLVPDPGPAWRRVALLVRTSGFDVERV
ncbi:MAG TPA: homoserine kinase [Actinomycetota bacterium]|nr:homoserine kinase [Actinomycetota bacterium]